MEVGVADHKEQIQKQENHREPRLPLSVVTYNNEYEIRDFQHRILQDQLSRLKNPKSHYLRMRVALGDFVGASWKEEDWAACHL